MKLQDKIAKVNGTKDKETKTLLIGEREGISAGDSMLLEPTGEPLRRVQNLEEMVDIIVIEQVTPSGDEANSSTHT